VTRPERSWTERIRAARNRAERVSGAQVAGRAIIHPRYGDASLADIMPSVLASLGVPGASDPLGLANGPLAGVRLVLVLLLDGYGYHLMPLAEPYAPVLSELARGRAARSLTSGFPSTTPTSLATLGTGASPGSHGVLGFFLNVPGTDRVLNHIRWADDPDPMRWQPLETQFDLARAGGVATHVVGRPEFEGTGLTTAAFRGGDYVGADDTEALADRVSEIMRTSTGRTVIYAYHADVDKFGHIFGVDSPHWRAAVAEVDRLAGMLLERMPADGALVVTADHGQVNVPPHRRFDLDTDPHLRAGIAVVAGESRVRYLHTVPGAREDVIAAWREVLGDAAWVASRDEAVADGWFGPVPEDHLQRIGDVVAACTGDYVVLATKTDPPLVGLQVAFHGSATAAEMLIPLLIGRP
jgi:hypothetical protein